MNRDELLTKLAMEIHPNDFDHGEPYNWYEFVFTGDEYLQRRTELINKPSWDDAPEWAEWLAQDKRGDWCFYPAKPEQSHDMWINDEPKTGIWVEVYCRGKNPSAHDWRQTLERRPQIAASGHTFSGPYNYDITTSLGATAFETDGGGDSYMFMTLEEQELPAEERHDCERCGGSWWSPHNAGCPCLSSKQARYRDAQGDDWIDEFARTATAEEFRGAMRFTIGKYNRRMGRKDEMVEEIRKMRDYCDRWMAYEEGE